MVGKENEPIPMLVRIREQRKAHLLAGCPFNELPPFVITTEKDAAAVCFELSALYQPLDEQNWPDIYEQCNAMKAAAENGYALEYLRERDTKYCGIDVIVKRGTDVEDSEQLMRRLIREKVSNPLVAELISTYESRSNQFYPLPMITTAEWEHRFRRRIAIRSAGGMTIEQDWAKWWCHVRAFFMRWSCFWPSFITEYPLPDPIPLDEEPEDVADDELSCWDDDG